MQCDNCQGKAYTISSVTSRETDCDICDGTGELEQCQGFNPGNEIAIFKSTRCIECNVRHRDHIKVMV